MNDSLTSQNSLTARQIDVLLQTMQELARLIDPLTTLLASTQTAPGAVGQRLEELMGRLSSVASGLELVVSQMLEMFSISGAIGQIPTRLQTLEVTVARNTQTTIELRRALAELLRIMRGT